MRPSAELASGWLRKKGEAGWGELGEPQQGIAKSLLVGLAEQRFASVPARPALQVLLAYWTS
jgi:hypothetical protein